MYIDLSAYRNKNICVAVSGGKDSMALLHYILGRTAEYNITLSALNCDHCMRGEESASDSAFVAEYCALNGVRLHFFKADGLTFKNEQEARSWRLECYREVISRGFADCIATAHHLSDNAETVIFNLARGTSLAGMTGICDEPSLNLIRPMIGCTREEIDYYIEGNSIPFVTDSTNLTCDYTRNKIRQSVLPALEEAVHGAAEAIFRFSRLAAEDEEYFASKVNEILVKSAGGYLIKPCPEIAVFRRAARKVVAEYFCRKDYTGGQFDTLYALQSMQNGKRFEFLNLCAVREEGGIAIFEEGNGIAETPFALGVYDGFRIAYKEDGVTADEKVLKFDLNAIPEGAVIRNRRAGDRFTKFGGGSKSLSDYLTDKKVPQSLRDKLVLVCFENEVLIIGGVEISEKVKLTERSSAVCEFICPRIL